MSFSTLNSPPARTATDASPAPSRVPTHGSRRNVDRLFLRFKGLPPSVICQLAWRTTALTVVMARHHRSVEPQARHASIGAARRQRLVGVMGVTEGHRQPVTANRSPRCRHPGASSWRFIIDPSNPQARHASIGAARRQRLVGVTGVTANRSPRCRHPGASSWRFIIDPSNPQARHASIGAARRQRLVGVTEGHRAVAILARHHGVSSPIR